MIFVAENIQFVLWFKTDTTSRDPFQNCLGFFMLYNLITFVLWHTIKKS